MKLDLLASITVSVAVHAGAVVMVSGWLEQMPPGVPASVPGIEEVVIEITAGEITAVDDSTATTAPAPDLPQEEQPQITSAPPIKTIDAPPAPTVIETPREIAPPQVVATATKIVEQAPIREKPKKQVGNPTIKSQSTESKITSGGGTTSAKYRSRASLTYPSSALRQRAGGRVVLSVDLDENGKAISVSVIVSSGRADLDAAATACARQSTYEPYRNNGIAQSSRVEAPFEFKLPR